MRITNIGLYPPPYGGVSIHLKRLLDYLISNNKDTILIDVSKTKKNYKNLICMSWRKTILKLIFSHKQILHFHNFSSKNTLIYFILSLHHKIILSFHNERFLIEIYRWPAFITRIIIWLLNRLDYIIVDSEHCLKLVRKIIKKENNIYVIPEYIPPLKIPVLTNKDILEKRKKFKYLIASNAFQITFYQEKDLYGIDMLIELMDRLINQFKYKIGLVFLLPNIGDENYFKKLQTTIKGKQLMDNILFVTTPIAEASSLWKISDMVIRATNTDGNALTVSEALALGVPVLASDCVKRPTGTILFETRNIDDLLLKVIDLLDNLDRYREKIKNLQIESSADKLLSLYEKVEREL